MDCRKYKLSKIFIIIAVLISFQLHVYSQVIIKGIVKDQKSKLPISFANIYIPEKRMGTASNMFGEFVFELNSIDSILVSAIGYESQLIYINYTVYKELWDLDISMVPKTYDLTEVVIKPYPTYDEFKRGILNYEMTPAEINAKSLQEAFRRNMAMLARRTNKDPLRYLKFSPELLICSPVTAVYTLFSRDVKNKRKYYQFLDDDKIKLKVGERLNFEVVSKLTGLKDEKEISEFLKYCNIPDTFVLASTDIQLYNRIMECYNEYSAID